MMASLRSRRLSKVEASVVAAVAAPTPHILRVGMSETRREAWGRFKATYPVLPPRHTGCFLVVPEKPATQEQHDQFAVRFKASQLACVAAVRSSYLQSADNPPGPSGTYTAVRRTKLESFSKPWTPGSRRN